MQLNRFIETINSPSFQTSHIFLDEAQVWTGQDISKLAAQVTAYFLENNITKPVLAVEDRALFSAVLLASLRLNLSIYLPAENLLSDFSSKSDFQIITNSLLRNLSVEVDEQEFVLPKSTSISFYLYTSGSSGKSTCIEKSLESLVAEVGNIEGTFSEFLPLSEYLVGTVNQRHIYGLIFTILWPLSTERIFANHVDLVPSSKEFSLVSSPAFLRIYSKSEDAMRHPKVIFSSGGPLSPDDAEMVKTFSSAEIIEVFGSTETGGIAWRTSGQTQWTIFKDVNVSVNGDGNMLVTSPFLLSSNATWESPDRIELDDSGRFMKHLGRSDRIVKVSEKRISLDQVEASLNSISGVQTSRATLVKSHRDEIVGFVILNQSGIDALKSEGRSSFCKSLRHELTKSLPGVAVPRRFRFLHELPQNSEGKTTVDALEALLNSCEDPEVHQILTDESGKTSVLFSVPRQTKYFKGHFDKIPILPGVIQLEWFRKMSVLAGLVSNDSEIVSIPKTKFQQPTFPGMMLKLELEVKSELKLNFSYLALSGELMSTGTIVFGEAKSE